MPISLILNESLLIVSSFRILKNLRRQLDATQFRNLQHLVRRAAEKEQRVVPQQVARQSKAAELRCLHESTINKDCLSTCCSYSSCIQNGLQPEQPSLIRLINTPRGKSTIFLRSTHSKSLATFKNKQILLKTSKLSFSTQAAVGKAEDLSGQTREISVMESSKPTQESQPPTVSDTTSGSPQQDENQAQSQQKKEKKAKIPKQPTTPAALPLSPALIDLRVGHILRCIPHENADSLYVSTIAMGDPEGADNTHKDEETGRIVRTVCSGLRGLIPLEQMQDRKVIVMANLKPVTMRGIKSAAMVLAASPQPKEGEDAHAADRVVELVSPPKGSEGGNRVYFEGFEYGEGKGPEKVLNPKKKQWEIVQPGLYTSEELTVVFDAGRLQGVEGGKGELVVEGVPGKCTVPTLKAARLS